MIAIRSRPRLPIRRRAALLASAALACFAFLVPAAQAASGDLDPSFGNGGSERFFPSEENTALRAVAIQPDGKIVLAGSDQLFQGILVVRLLPNGELDAGFGEGGVVITTIPGAFAEARAVAIQPDGKIVVAGAAGTTTSDFVAARYETNGAPDPSFGGGDGIETVPLAGTNDRAEAVTVGAGGRILLTGERGACRWRLSKSRPRSPSSDRAGNPTRASTPTASRW